MSLRLAISVLLAALLLVGGCGTARHRAETDLVRHIELTGNSDFFLSAANDWILREQMAQKASSPGLLAPVLRRLVDGEPLIPGALEGDVWPIEVYLAHHGWFDAQLLGWEQQQVKPATGRKVAVWDLVGQLDLGPVTRWEPVHLDWVGTHRSDISEEDLARLVPIKEGKRFQLSQVYSGQRKLERFFHNSGYPRAEVEVEVEVWPEEQRAQASYTLSSGVKSNLGRFRFHGLERAPGHVLRRAMSIRPSQPYSESRLEDARDELLSLGVFTSVEIVPDMEAKDPRFVPLDIYVEEGLLRRLELGGSVGFESGMFASTAKLRWLHRNVAGELIQLDTRAQAGLAYRTATSELSPLGEVGADIKVPRFPSDKFDLFFDGGGQRDLFEGELLRDRLDLGTHLLYRLKLPGVRSRPLQLSLGPHYDLVTLEDSSDEVLKRLVDSVLGQDFTSPYGIASLQAAIVWRNVRDDGNGARQGYDYSVRWRRALPVLSDHAFDDVAIDGRGYWRPEGLRGAALPIGVATRVSVRGLRGAGGREVPWAERLFLGGAGDLRGFRAGHVGPYDCVCLPGEGSILDWAMGGESVRRRYLPHGGLFSALAVGELHYQGLFIPSLSGVVFAEIGSLTSTLSDLADPSTWRLDGGVGVRLNTPLGPVRVDVAVRPIYPEDHGPASTIGCDGVEDRRRAFDLISEVGRTQPFDRNLPSINLVIGIGEAF